LKAFFFYDILITLKQVRKTEYFGVCREPMVGENRLWRYIQITFKLRFMD